MDQNIPTENKSSSPPVLSNYLSNDSNDKVY
jgi:hypothetical protein